MKNTLIKEIMSTELITLSPYETLSTAKELFDKNNIHHIPVIHKEELVGIMSYTDIERSKQGKTLFIDHNIDKHNDVILKATLVCMVMTDVVETIDSNESIFKAYKIFKQNRFRSLPVFEDGKLKGIITPMDFLDYLFIQN